MDDRSTLTCRRAADGDYEQIVALQDANLRGLPGGSAGVPADGFLSARFTIAQYRAMNEDLAVVVASDGEALAGYLCAQSPAFNRDVPIVQTMVAGFDAIDFGGRPLSRWSTCICGPVVVAGEYRGRGVFPALYAELKQQLAGLQKVGVCFISRENPRSLKAHVDKAGMQVVSTFEFQGGRYDILAVNL